MATPEFAQWLARGRTHQWEGRPVDAMLCFRRALRADPLSADARFHLGEVLWQLGRIPAAVATWREATDVAPDHLAPRLALCEALLATGDAAGAAEAAARALALAPAEPRALASAAVAALTLAVADASSSADDALRAVDAVVADHPSLVAVAAIAGPLALALDRTPPGAARDRLLDTIAAASAQALAAMPALLVAQCIERRGTDATSIADAAARRGYAGGDHDALRRIARAARLCGSTNAESLAALYAKVCKSQFGTAMPLTWPRRTAGDRLRVVVLVASADERGFDTLDAIVRVPAQAFDIVVAVVGDGDGALVSATARAHASRIMALGAQPGIDGARALATFDADVLVDAVGLSAPVGALLAQRCAHAVQTVGTLAAPNAPPLVDRVFADAAEIVASLRERHAALGQAPACTLTASQMTALWDEALRAHQQQDLARARDGYDSLLAAMPGHASALHLGGLVHRDAGRHDEARRAFDAAVAAAPDYVDARLAAISAANAGRDGEHAITLALAGLERAPATVALWRALGHAQLAARDGEAAAAAFERALALEATDGETHYNHGVALQMQRRYADAARAYQRALAFRPDFVDADFNLAVMFQQQGAVDAAVAAYENVLVHDPSRVAAYRNLGELLLDAGRIDAWVRNFRRFERHCPTALPLAVQALEVCQYTGDFGGVERYLEGLRNETFRASDEAELVDALEQLLYLLLYFDVEPEMLLEFARTYDATARHAYGEPLPRPARRRPGKFRIGYLSGDLRDHVMGKMAWSAVEHHDRDRFQLHFYSLSTLDDAWTERFRGMAHRFVVVADLDERRAAQRIADDDLDVLVDLSTHTKGGKPGILAFKPARVQITHVASAGTVGLSTVDFKLTDRYADVPENASYQIEPLLEMDGCVYPYRHVEPAAKHPFSRDALGIAHDAVVIGAFVSGLKLTRRCLTLWREVLARVPRAKLALSPVKPALRSLYVQLLASGGIAADRLLFLPQGRNDAENQARYSIVDFVLDPMPYGGVNGVLEPLDAGVPVVTLVGKRHGERSAYSILANLGVTHTVAQSGREYVDIATRLATDPRFMRDVRDAVLAGLAHSALTDRVGHTRALERAYLAALAAKAPEALSGASP